MFNEKETKILQLAVEKFGQGPQIDMCIEEMSELTKAICKWKRKINNETLYNISEEIADVYIMLEQMKMIFNNKEEIKKIKKEKLQRLNTKLLNIETSKQIK